MKQSDLLTNLPSDIIIDILSRLSIPTIIRCKSVCKPWLHILRSHEFATHHLSTSAPALAVFQYKITSELYDIYEFEDDDQHYKLLTSFMPPCRGMIQGSANGFLVLRDLSLRPHGLSICNPITREYMEIHSPPEFDYTYPQVAAFGFGASRITGQHKVVRVFHGREIPECHVYTLGTGSWRSVASSALLRYGNGSIGAFLNGNLHWLVFDSNGKPWISCFDLETELFSIISPPLPLRTQRWPVAGVFAFQDKLCVCDNSSEDEIVVWLEKEYGDEKSWSKVYVMAKTEDFIGECDVRPIKMFKDGDVSMAWGDFFLFHYSSKTKAVSEMRMFEARGNCALDLIPYTCTFLSLNSFGIQNVYSF